MKQIIINIPDDKYAFFIELVKSLDFVQMEEMGDSKEEIIANLKEGFKEMKQFKEGRLKGTPLEDFLDEL
jgi:hypothetical protein